MKFQLFGSKNVRTPEELRSVGRRKSTLRKIDDWRIDSVSALRVPIISSKVSSSQAIRLVSNNYLRDVSLPKSSRKKVGIYSSSIEYCSELSAQLLATDLEVFSFSNKQSASDFKLEEANAMDAWLIHMDDADENPWLDCLLDLGASVSSLFLFEQSMTKQCLNKIQEFMLETRCAS
ncbi:MAG: hypothetical protein ACI8O8_000147 [Oleiphilaceae bacterium]|jgi:hypothetical protein